MTYYINTITNSFAIYINITPQLNSDWIEISEEEYLKLQEQENEKEKRNKI